MDTEGLSVICAGIGTIEVDDEGNVIGYIKGQYCLGTNLSHFQFPFVILLFFRIRSNENFRFLFAHFRHRLPDNLKDLLRFLRRDDPQTRDVFKQVCKWNIVSKYLIPTIELYHEDRNLLLNAGFYFLEFCISIVDKVVCVIWLIGGSC